MTGSIRTHERMYPTSDIVIMFARQGVAISTIARAMAIQSEQVERVCTKAKERDELQMIPPATPDDTRHAMLSELTNLRAQLDTAQYELRDARGNARTQAESITGVAGLTRQEALWVAAVMRLGRASKANLYHALYGDDVSAVDRDPKIIDVIACKVRKKLTGLGIEIGTIWGFGYEMSRASIEKMRALAGAEVIEAPTLVPTQQEMMA